MLGLLLLILAVFFGSYLAIRNVNDLLLLEYDVSNEQRFKSAVIKILIDVSLIVIILTFFPNIFFLTYVYSRYITLALIDYREYLDA